MGVPPSSMVFSDFPWNNSSSSFRVARVAMEPLHIPTRSNKGWYDVPTWSADRLGREVCGPELEYDTGTAGTEASAFIEFNRFNRHAARNTTVLAAISCKNWTDLSGTFFWYVLWSSYLQINLHYITLHHPLNYRLLYRLKVRLAFLEDSCEVSWVCLNMGHHWGIHGHRNFWEHDDQPVDLDQDNSYWNFVTHCSDLFSWLLLEFHGFFLEFHVFFFVEQICFERQWGTMSRPGSAFHFSVQRGELHSGTVKLTGWPLSRWSLENQVMFKRYRLVN